MSIVERLKDDKRIKLFGEILLLHHNAELDCIVPSDQGGFIPARNEMEELLIEISRFYETTSDTEIEEYNEMVYSKKFSREDRATRQQEKIVKKYAGYVYLIKADNGLYKIGKTRNISERMKPFSVSFPMAWYMVHHFTLMITLKLRKHYTKRIP